MKEKRKEVTIPILWEGWDEPGPGGLQFYEVEFYRDFGPFKEGECFGCVYVDFGKGILEAYTEDGQDVAKRCNFVAVAIN